MIWILVVASLVLLVYFALAKPFKYWKNKGVPQANFRTLWLENIQGILQLRSQADLNISVYNNFENYRYAGSYQFFTPMLFLRDPDLIKQITVKDFDHFIDHYQFLSEEIEPLWGKNLFALRGDKWRNMRATLSPCFTSSKMRAMFGFMNECAKQFVNHFQMGNSNTVIVEFKDAFIRFANDIIASTAFGLLGIQLFSSQAGEFFRRLIRTNVESREKNRIVRLDMIELLMEARKGRWRHEGNINGLNSAVTEKPSLETGKDYQTHQLTDEDLTAQALIFFFAGFESISTLMCFAVYELAVNPDMQKKLQHEIDEDLEVSGGSLTYDGLLKMKYLDMITSEVLRKWPTVIAVDRVCVKPYTIQPTTTSENPINLQKGDILWLPIFALHRDAHFYQDPERFDPERFSDENKDSIYPYSYIPFGAGPRNCIGNRFALLEVKTMLFYILSKFDITVVEKSPVPMKLAKHPFNLTGENEFLFGLAPRKL